MTVFLGSAGKINLKRLSSAESYRTLVNPADVNAAVNRFSVDFAHEQIITGDYLYIRTVDQSDLNWIDDSSADDQFSRYCHVDEAGGIRLYNTFEQAIAGDKNNAIKLKTPTTAQECTISISGSPDPRCLAQVTKYQITTSRSTIDTTHLGAHYRKQYEAGLIQGQGQIECFWVNECPCSTSGDEVEFSAYLARLCIRLVHGAAFEGQFYIYADETNQRRSVWYESSSCVVTNVAVTVSPEEIVRSTIDFVTNGPIALREGYIPSFLDLEESDFSVKLEQSPGGRIELEAVD